MFFRNKKGEEIDELVKIIIVVVIIVVMVGVIFLFKDKASSTLDAIKHMLHFGK